MLSTPEKSILNTLAYFDIFEYPLTLAEIKKNLFTIESCEKISLLKLEQIINNDNLKNIISQQNGFYFLTNNNKGLNPSKGVQPLRSKFWQTRQSRYLLAEPKFKKAKKIAKLLSFIPYIKMIAVCNSLGYSNASKNSDIDFFVVTTKNRIWITRLLSVFLIKFLNLRPKPQNTKDKICLSFFVDEENLNLEKFKITSKIPPDKGGWGVSPDIYLTYWSTQLIPIFDANNIYDKFWQANSWVEKFLPNRQKYFLNSRRQIKTKNRNKIYKLNFLENLAKKIQLAILNPELKKLMNQDTRVVVNDGVLKLYTVDRREEYLKLWKKNTPCSL